MGKLGPHSVRQWVAACMLVSHYLKLIDWLLGAKFNEIWMKITWWRHQIETFPRNWPFVRGIQRSQVNSQHKGQWRGAFMFSLICTWINGSVNNREAGDLSRHRIHYDVTVMGSFYWPKMYMIMSYWMYCEQWFHFIYHPPYIPSPPPPPPPPPTHTHTHTTITNPPASSSSSLPSPPFYDTLQQHHQCNSHHSRHDIESILVKETHPLRAVLRCWCRPPYIVHDGRPICNGNGTKL